MKDKSLLTKKERKLPYEERQKLLASRLPKPKFKVRDVIMFIKPVPDGYSTDWEKGDPEPEGNRIEIGTTVMVSEVVPWKGIFCEKAEWHYEFYNCGGLHPENFFRKCNDKEVEEFRKYHFKGFLSSLNYWLKEIRLTDFERESITDDMDYYKKLFLG